MRPEVHEIAEGEVYKDARVTVRAFEVPHTGWKHAFGYRVQTPDKVIVISGDARANPAIARECAGCDILVHEVYSDSGFTLMAPVRQKYHAQAHTSATQLGDIATAARPGLLVLYHQLFFGVSDEQLLKEVRSRFTREGRVGKGPRALLAACGRRGRQEASSCNATLACERCDTLAWQSGGGAREILRW